MSYRDVAAILDVILCCLKPQWCYLSVVKAKVSCISYKSCTLEWEATFRYQCVQRALSCCKCTKPFVCVLADGHSIILCSPLTNCLSTQPWILSSTKWSLYGIRSFVTRRFVLTSRMFGSDRHCAFQHRIPINYSISGITLPDTAKVKRLYSRWSLSRSSTAALERINQRIDSSLGLTIRTYRTIRITSNLVYCVIPCKLLAKTICCMNVDNRVSVNRKPWEAIFFSFFELLWLFKYTYHKRLYYVENN